MPEEGKPGKKTRVYAGCDGVMVPVVTEAEKVKRRERVKAKRRRAGKKCRPLPPRKRGADIWRGGLPHGAGAPAEPLRLRRRLGGIVPIEWAVYLGSIALVPVFVFLVSSGAIFTADHRPMVF